MAGTNHKALGITEAEFNVLQFIRDNKELGGYLRDLHDWAIHFNQQPVEDEQKCFLYHANRLGRLIERM